MGWGAWQGWEGGERCFGTSTVIRATQHSSICGLQLAPFPCMPLLPDGLPLYLHCPLLAACQCSGWLSGYMGESASDCSGSVDG